MEAGCLTSWCPSHDGTGPPSQPLTGREPYVVVIFGHTGVGVSSLVNLIAGIPVSDYHPDSQTCTNKSKRHLVTLPGSEKQFCLFEVPGFRGNPNIFLNEIRRLEREEVIDLFIYCLRKQKSTVIPHVVRSITEDITGGEVPIAAVVTELEKFEGSSMEEWWTTSLEKGKTNGNTLESMHNGMVFNAHACVTTLPRKDTDLVKSLRKRRDDSEEVVWRLIKEQCAGSKRTHTGRTYS
ncbi:hypothetical protein BDN67DRAFT_968409 [Paxillus ammoniavirescens]|nr:hypothetical protein BDN67DRAFT_968409 [Paxillus ammoniavirescens]